MENTGASGSNNINKAKKTGTKRKIPIDLIENKDAREVLNMFIFNILDFFYLYIIENEESC